MCDDGEGEWEEGIVCAGVLVATYAGSRLRCLVAHAQLRLYRATVHSCYHVLSYKTCFVIKTLTALVLAFSIPCIAHGQALELLWAQSIQRWTSSPDQELLTTTGTLSSQGEVILAGGFSHPTDFDPGQGTAMLIPVGYRDIFVSKADFSGNFLWVKALNGTNVRDACVVATDAVGSIYVGGSFWGIIDADPGPDSMLIASPGGEVGFVIKLTADGDVVWAKTINSSGQRSVSRISAPSTGGVYVMGQNLGGTTRDFIEKLSSVDGTSEWIRSPQGSTSFRAMTVDVAGNVIVGGAYVGTVDFDPDSAVVAYTANVSFPSFVWKLDRNGAYQWVQHVDPSSNTVINTIAVDVQGRIMVGGLFTGSIKMPISLSRDSIHLGSIGSYDMLLARMSPEGVLEWACSIGGLESDLVKNVVLDKAGNIFAVSFFSDTLVFGCHTEYAPLTVGGGPGMLLLKLNSSGHILSTASFKGGFAGTGLALDTACNPVIFGRFSGAVDFDPGPGITTLISAGAHIFFAKFAGGTDCTEVVPGDIDVSTTLYPNPASGYTTLQLGRLTEPVRIRLRDAVGRHLRDWPETNMPSLDLDVATLPSGVYLVEVIGATSRRVLQLVKQ